MKMSNHADALREALVRSAGLGDERARRIAGDLADAAGPALQLQTLAIAADLAETYDGSLELGRSALGGLQITLRLPC